MARARDRGGVVADNLRALIGEESVNNWSKRHHLAQPTVRRILIGEISPTETMIATIAESCGLMAWQLLVPGLDPRHLPVLREANDAERALYERIASAVKELKKFHDQ